MLSSATVMFNYWPGTVVWPTHCPMLQASSFPPLTYSITNTRHILPPLPSCSVCPQLTEKPCLLGWEAPAANLHGEQPYLPALVSKLLDKGLIFLGLPLVSISAAFLPWKRKPDQNYLPGTAASFRH